MGSLDFVGSSHCEGYMAKVETRATPPMIITKPIIAKRKLPVVSSGMAAGDATFHAG